MQFTEAPVDVCWSFVDERDPGLMQKVFDEWKGKAQPSAT